MKLSRAIWLRLLLMVFLLGLAVWMAGVYDLGRIGVQMAPDLLTAYRPPLYLAGMVGTASALVVAKVGFDWSGVVRRGDGASARAVALLRRLRRWVVVTAAYLAVCTVGMTVVLSSMALGMVGVWLAALLAEALLLSAVLALRTQQRRIEGVLFGMAQDRAVT